MIYNPKKSLLRAILMCVVLMIATLATFSVESNANLTTLDCLIQVNVKQDSNTEAYYLLYDHADNNNGSWDGEPPNRMSDGTYTFKFTWDAKFMGTRGMDVDVYYYIAAQSDNANLGSIKFHVHCNAWADSADYIDTSRTACSSGNENIACHVSTKLALSKSILEFEVKPGF